MTRDMKTTREARKVQKRVSSDPTLTTASEAGDKTDASGPRERTKIILSFGAQDGGATFAQWLRLKLCERLQLDTGQPEVYLDTIDLRSKGGTTLALTLPGTKEKKHTGGHSGGVAALNPDWNKHYTTAMSEADVMVFVLTREWQKSPNCEQEYAQFCNERQRRETAIREHKRRPEEGPPPRRLIGLSLVFPGEKGAPSGLACTAPIYATKQPFTNAPKKALDS